MTVRDGGFRVHVAGITAFILMAAIAGALLGLSYWAENKVRASLEARTAIERLHRAIVEAERAQRAYILTREIDYLADANEARAKLDGLADTVRAAVARRAIEDDLVGGLLRLIEQRDGQLDEALEALQSDGMEAAVRAVRENELRRTSARIFDAVAAIEEEENRALAERERYVGLVRMMLLVAIFGVTGATLLSITARLRAEQRLAAGLEQANRDLEHRVQERTSDLAMERGRIEHLLRELSHRVGNNLSMVSSFLLLEAMKAEDDNVRRALENAHQRILGIASAQRRLRIDTDSAHVDLAPYLAAIVEDVRQTLPGEGISLAIEAEALQLRGADAVALGIIVNELVTNALKHAFPDGRGSVAVSLETQRGSVLLEVSDNGSGFSGNEGAGLGALLVRSMVAALEGRVARTIGSGPRPGTRWVIQFPLRKLPVHAAPLRAETGP